MLNFFEQNIRAKLLFYLIIFFIHETGVQAVPPMTDDVFSISLLVFLFAPGSLS